MGNPSEKLIWWSRNMSTRKRTIQFWGPGIVVLSLAGLLLVTNDSSRHFKDSFIIRNLRYRNEVYTPYDKSSKMGLPKWTDRLVNVWEKVENHQIPFFWHVPSAGGNVISQVFRNCLGLTVVQEITSPVTNLTQLGLHDHEDQSVFRYSRSGIGGNISLSHQESWIQKTVQSRELLTSDSFPIIMSSQHSILADAHTMITKNQGRGFVMMRHPVKRVIDHFLHQQRQRQVSETSNELKHPSLPTLLDFVTSDHTFMDNMQVRLLNDIADYTTIITEEHLNLAKEILRRKFLVGIYEWFDVGMVRFEKYFGWWKQYDVLNNLTTNSCHVSVIESGGDDDDSPDYSWQEREDAEKVYATIMSRSWADVELFRYAKLLFVEQAKLM